MAPHSLVAQIDAALLAHEDWRRKLVVSIRDDVQVVPAADLACEDRCAFGRWLLGPELDEATRATKPWQVVRRLHGEFHQVAGRVAGLAEAGRKGEAYALLDGQYAAHWQILARALAKWREEAVS